MDPISEKAVINVAKTYAKNSTNVVGLDDDAACIPQPDGSFQLVTTDSLLEGIHFNQAISPRELGYKALAVNLSDIAAMGGVPNFATISLSIPSSTTEPWIKQFYSGWNELASKHNVELIGGDTTSSPSGIFINVTVIGNVQATNVKLRSSAKEGDVIAVTGALGDARAGLELILADNETTDHLVEAHFLPTPQLIAGRIFSDHQDVHALTDVSDGLASDMEKICEASKVGASIDLDALPISDHLTFWAKQMKIDAQEFAAAGGEDYQLLCTMLPNCFDAVQTKLREAGITLTAIGSITNTGQVMFHREQTPVVLTHQNFSHFS